jgi:hypothetical protein
MLRWFVTRVFLTGERGRGGEDRIDCACARHSIATIAAFRSQMARRQSVGAL